MSDTVEVPEPQNEIIWQRVSFEALSKPHDNDGRLEITVVAVVTTFDGHAVGADYLDALRLFVQSAPALLPK